MASDPPIRFGLHLRSYRIKCGYTLREFARAIGMSATHLSYIEQGLRAIDPCDIEKIVIEFGLPRNHPDVYRFYDLAAWEAGGCAYDVQVMIRSRPELAALVRRVTFGLVTEKEVSEAFR